MISDDGTIPRFVLEAELTELLAQAREELHAATNATAGTFVQWERGVDKAQAVVAFLHKRLADLRKPVLKSVPLA